ncbi:hypothetical protein FEM48_Zijuj08G0149100 [Ziziphus jujuba var. spinosa]|uniref:Uncharacterized protein n=1 Tax=Ziziphus jujuba var. spinosa TaxID=714518 RepID=A0A978UZS2_ZIZJJ|nr:hypothetical protein FEM48_Zijuj08G0149100 [Ziziphus jujuba var. spinosa]
MEEANAPLLEQISPTSMVQYEDEQDQVLTQRFCRESKKLWDIVAPAIFSRLASFSMFVITQAFAGHLGDHEFAAVSIANNVIINLNFGLLSQLKNIVIAWVSLVALVVHVILSWLFVYKLQVGVVGTAITLDISWWILAIGQLSYAVFGGCPLTWSGFCTEAFSGLWEFIKLSAASGVMLCLEVWYYAILVLMTGNLANAEVAVDALSICMTINGWAMNIPLAFFNATGIRVANELGAGNGKGAKFATTVSVVTSIAIGLLFCLLIMIFHKEIAFIFSSSKPVLQQVNKLYILLAFTLLLNSVQPILSGVAVGCGWQSYVAYINLGCYYIIGVPVGFFMGWFFNKGVMSINSRSDTLYVIPLGRSYLTLKLL